MKNLLKLFMVSLFLVALPLKAADFITVQSTTSTRDSGLQDYLLPIYTKKTGVDVKIVAVGTGQAIKNAANGDGDVLLVHAKADEEKFVADGLGVKRYDLMYNDFIVIGPHEDSAKIKDSQDVIGAFQKIAEAKANFVTRGDDSGTHKMEKNFWKAAGISPQGEWYRDVGAGMGQAINVAVSSNSYILSDRATWAAFGNKGNLEIVVEGDKKLFNQYGVILVNPDKFPSVKAKLGQQFIDWLLSSEGQAAINEFKVGGKQMFFANAAK